MKISIVKQSVVIIALSFDESAVKFLQEANPKSLALHDSDGTETFKLAITKDEPSFNRFGVTFNPKREIVISKNRPVTVEDVKLEYGATLLKITALEVQVKDAYAEYQASADQLSFEELA
jgi:hypothetical protein